MRVIILTGGSRGLGKALLTLLQDRPGYIIVVGLNPPLLQDNSTAHVTFIRKDFTSAEEFSDVIAALPAATSELILINNAGKIDPIDQVGTFSPEAMRQAMAVNTLAPLMLVNALVDGMQSRTISFKILHISSGAADQPINGWSLYCTSKAATKMFFHCLAQEKPHIEIKQINPGVLDTDMQALIRSTSPQQCAVRQNFIDLKENHALRSPEEAALAILSQEGLL